MAEVRICMEVDGLARDKAGRPCPGGMCLTLHCEREVTPEEYEELIQSVRVEGLLEMARLSGRVRPEACRIVPPEEYDRLYGEEADHGA